MRTIGLMIFNKYWLRKLEIDQRTHPQLFSRIIEYCKSYLVDVAESYGNACVETEELDSRQISDAANGERENVSDVSDRDCDS